MATVRRWAVPRFLVVQAREMSRDQRRGAAVVNYCYHRVKEPVAAEQELECPKHQAAVEQGVGCSWFRIAAAELEVECPNQAAE